MQRMLIMIEDTIDYIVKNHDYSINRLITQA